MHLELVEALRCIRSHADSVLVAAAHKLESRAIVEGALGCPVCHAEYPIRNGVTCFTEPVAELAGAADASDEAAMRLAAQIALTESRGVFVLAGFPHALVQRIRAICAARVVQVNAGAPALEGTSLNNANAPFGNVVTGALLPFARNKLQAFALANDVPSVWLEQARMIVRAGGRLVAPASTIVPEGFRELVRDTEVWVAERQPEGSAPVQLRRG